MPDPQENAEKFFATARERQKIYRRRQQGLPPPWTDDPVMQSIYLCNVFREQDKTTVWFRENARNFYISPLYQFASIILFRWFNRISTGEYFFNHSVFRHWLEDIQDGIGAELAGWRLGDLIEEDLIPPYFTGAFMIKLENDTPKHYSVANAASLVVEGYIRRVKEVGTPILFNRLQDWTEWLKKFHGLGGFMAYEAASDIRWTQLGENSIDILTYANIGPGCARGLSRLYYDTPEFSHIFMKERGIDVLKWLLELSRDEEYWPQDETPWELRECEHWSCEFDKIERIRRGEGRSKRMYKSHG